LYAGHVGLRNKPRRIITMTNEERDLISRFVARIAGAPQGGSFTGGSVPQSAQPLPPVDRDADAFIAQQFQQYPEARYRMTQTALVQEGALAETQNQVRRLQWELEQTRHAMQNQPQQSPQQKGFFSSLFGGGASPQPQRGQQGYGQPGYGQAFQPTSPPPQPQRPQSGMGGGMMGGQPGYGQAFQPTSAPPQPQYPPNYQPGMFQQRGGSGFLGSALTTAAGVAGGMVVGNALMGAFSGNHGSGGGLFGGGSSNTADSGSPWDGAGVSPVSDPGAGFLGGADAGGADPFAGGGSEKDSSFGGGGFDQASDPFGGSGDSGGGGFDGGGGGGGGFDGGGGGGFDQA